MGHESRGVIGTLSIKNIGGISTQQVDLCHGVNVLAGHNATNRTSLLKALAAAQGSTNVSLKGNADAGSVTLSIEDEQYTREVRAVDDALVFEGDCPVAEADRDVAELFAFLFERNRAREAIRQGSDLRSVVMEPVDTAAIQDDLATLRAERSEQEADLEQLRDRQRRLPSLRDRRDELAAEIEQLESAITETKAEIEASGSDIDEQTDETQRLEAMVSQLRATESELDTVRSKIESTEKTISQLQQDRADARSELAAVDAVDEAELGDVTAELERLHEQLATKESMMNELQSVIQFNEDAITSGSGDGASVSMLSASQAPDSTDAVTDRLVTDGDGLTCWTCGGQTTRSQISETLERLQAVHEDLYGERDRLKRRIEEEKARKDELEATLERRSSLQETIEELSAQVERHEASLAQLRETADELTADIDEYESEITTLRQEREDELLDRHQELNNLELDLSETREEHESVRQEIADIESAVDRIDTVEGHIDYLTSRIEELHQRVDDIERQAIAGFNEHMGAILDILEYRNLERVWVERRDVTTREGRKKVQQSRFDLHVVREDEDGTTYEDTRAHLSESEREVTGLIFALAGYLVHDVHETVPFMLLDSLEAIDSNRIALLIDYLREYADNIVVALLTEDAAALDDGYNRIMQPTPVN